MVVSEASGSHFVFLGLDQLKWVKGVLESAAESGWKIPPECVKNESRRRIAIFKVWKKGQEMLAVSEKWWSLLKFLQKWWSLRSGKIFYVLIPPEPRQRGWWSLLKALRGMCCEVGETLEWMQVKNLNRSFASVVKGPSASPKGECSVVCLDGTIPVADDGVNARLKFLSKCIVLRVFNSIPEPLDLSCFRRWMSTNWGVSSSTPLSELGDDCWLLECSSEEEVDRVLSLDKRSFGSSKIFMDKWVKNAGRTEVLKNQGLAWILVGGIPLHLLSSDLFMKIGDRCGGFVEANSSSCLFGSVRIKVKKSGVLPSRLSLQFNEEVYVVTISENLGLRELCSNPVVLGDVPCSIGTRVGVSNKGKCSLEKGKPRRWSLEQGQCSRNRQEKGGIVSPLSGEVVNVAVAAASSESVAAGENFPTPAKAALTQEAELLPIVQYPLGNSMVPFDSSYKATEEVQKDIVDLEDDILNSNKRLVFSGSSLNETPGLFLPLSHFSLEEENVLESCLFLLGLGPRSILSRITNDVECMKSGGPLGNLLSFEKSSGGLVSREVNSPFRWDVVDGNIDDSPVDNLCMVSGGVNDEPSEIVSNVSWSEDVPVCDQALDLVDFEEHLRLKETVFEVASLVGLQMDGSSEAARERASLLVDEVCLRKGSKKRKSRLERELRRLSGTEVISPSSRSRRSIPESLCGSGNFEWECKPSVGASGGIISIWDKDMFVLEGSWIGSYCVVTIFKNTRDGFVWMLINVYAPCALVDKRRCIEELRNVFGWWLLPSCFMGDFNMIRSGIEALGQPRSLAEMSLFNDFVEELCLVDMPLSGARFTWTNFRDPPSFSRIDRVLVSTEWEGHFPSCSVVAKPRVCSDHSPLIIQFDSFDTIRRPWRFELMWFEHEDFVRVVVQNWVVPCSGVGGLFRCGQKLKRLKGCLKEWNSLVFKNVDREVQRLMGAIDELDRHEEESSLDPVGRFERIRYTSSPRFLLRGGALQEWHSFLQFLDGRPTPIVSMGPARVVWTLQPSSCFTVSSLRAALRTDAFPGVTNFPHKNIWVKEVPTKVQGFLWLVFYGRILTLDNLRRRGFLDNLPPPCADLTVPCKRSRPCSGVEVTELERLVRCPSSIPQPHLQSFASAVSQQPGWFMATDEELRRLPLPDLQLDEQPSQPRCPRIVFSEEELRIMVVAERIARFVGNSVRVDVATTIGERTRYARACVELDLSKPLLGKYELDKKEYEISYESLEEICIKCGFYGHLPDKCKGTAIPMEMVDGQYADSRSPPPKHTDDVGEWMLGGRSRNRKLDSRISAPSSSQPADGDSQPVLVAPGSRFAALSHQHEEVESAPVTRPSSIRATQEKQLKDAVIGTKLAAPTKPGLKIPALKPVAKHSAPKYTAATLAQTPISSPTLAIQRVKPVKLNNAKNEVVQGRFLLLFHRRPLFLGNSELLGRASLVLYLLHRSIKQT
ncbi:hypothetical protein LINGRAHAP2_LOCUS32067 [Linum grandiflorum]